MATASLNESCPAGNGLPAIMPVLSLVNGKPRASSLGIAEHFKKRHDNVLRSITQTCHDLPSNFCALNFEETSITVPGPKGGTRQERAYLMTRDGFALIVMSFTGKEAMIWKLRYIEAFNAMEAELCARQAPALPSADLTKLTTVADRRPLKALVDAWVAAAKTNGKFLAHTEAFRIARTPVGGRKMKELTLADVPVAMAYVQEQLDRELCAASPMIAQAQAPAPEVEAPKAPTTIKALPGRRRITELDRADIARRLGLLKQRTNSLILEYFEFTRELHQPFNDVACDKDNYDPDVAGMMTAVNYGLQYFNRVACGNLETMQALAEFATHATTAFRKVEHLPASGVK